MPGFGASCPLLGATFPTTSTTQGHCTMIGEQSSLPAAPRKGYAGEEIRKGRDEEVCGQRSGGWAAKSLLALSDWTAAGYGSAAEHGCPFTGVRM